MDTTIAVDQPEWARERLFWRISLTPIHVLGILAAIYRISRRYKTRQSGLDDYAATLALILDLILFPTLWLRNADVPQTVPISGLSTAATSGRLLGDNLPADLETPIAQVVIGWVVQVVYPLLTWTAKASLALTIARLIPFSHFTHKASIALACLSVLAGLGIVIQTCIYCAEVDKAWSHMPPYRCKVTAVAGILRSGSEVIIDIILVIIPFVTFFHFRLPCPWTVPKQPSPTAIAQSNNDPPTPVRPRLRLPPLTRRLLQISFLAGLLTTSTAILIPVFLFKIQNSNSIEIHARIGYMAFVLSHLNGSVSLLVCNLLIVITSLYRLLRAPPRIVEIGKPPVVPDLSDQGNSRELESGSGAPTSNSTSNDTSGTGRSERVTAEGNVSENSGPMTSSGEGMGSGSGPTKKSSSSTSAIELTELFESDFSIA